MNKRRRYRSVLVLGTVGLLLTVACGLWLRSERRQEDLNRQLIAALVKIAEERMSHTGPFDDRQALALVNAGADPNTPFKPLPQTSLGHLWNWLVHRTALPRNYAPSAFLLVCGACWYDENSRFVGINSNAGSASDAPRLVETMLRHGANKNAKDDIGYTPLMWSIRMAHPKTFDVLLQDGADVNAQSQDGTTPLLCAIWSYDGPDVTGSFCRQLIAHGAAPNLPDTSGMTALQLAQQTHCPDLVALLKQSGAKK